MNYRLKTPFTGKCPTDCVFYGKRKETVYCCNILVMLASTASINASLLLLLILLLHHLYCELYLKSQLTDEKCANILLGNWISNIHLMENNILTLKEGSESYLWKGI